MRERALDNELDHPAVSPSFTASASVTDLANLGFPVPGRAPVTSG
jgi:hypothetical protein